MALSKHVTLHGPWSGILYYNLSNGSLISKYIHRARDHLIIIHVVWVDVFSVKKLFTKFHIGTMS